MIKPPEEWFKQADYDLETAEAMFKTKRYIYTVFMCHLSVEKALKGLYAKSFQKDPPKTHDLLYLVNKIQLNPDEERLNFFKELTNASIPTRYPDELAKLFKIFTKDKTGQILVETKEILKWLTEKLKTP